MYRGIERKRVQNSVSQHAAREDSDMKLDRRNTNKKYRKKLPTDHRHQFVSRYTDFYAIILESILKRSKKLKAEHHFGSIATVRNDKKRNMRRKKIRKKTQTTARHVFPETPREESSDTSTPT